MSGVAGPMSGLVSGTVTPARRVRHDVRDGLAVMVFSAVASVALAVALLLISVLIAGLGK